MKRKAVHQGSPLDQWRAESGSNLLENALYLCIKIPSCVVMVKRVGKPKVTWKLQK
jgi:hypothetical protein